ncbi:response regulator transcription factor [Hymenobacter sp. BT664]|uniref:Response regulator transcription factor n=1 Tax=Hymenobacter montanus TaxID=2771359 RepID=A0A927GIN4_9BACT|nr:LytTR family DNA-binding domain-containing protein [Hymenobacter montanus]MBD2767261.1 response regulator transcription factor [Hymenobacter montanus]
MAETLTQILLVDDEPLAREVLERYVGTRPDLRLAGSCANAYEALAVLRQTPVDIMCCDIKMPEVDGFALIRSLPQPPRIILTTAYAEYALPSYDLGVVDYLLKPIALNRFLKALDRALLVPPAAPIAPPPRRPLDYLFFKVDKAFRKVFVQDIAFIEACGNYVKVHMTGGEALLVPGKISALAATLDDAGFVRVHKSYLVALANIRQVEGSLIQLGRATVPLSESYRAAFLARL